MWKFIKRVAWFSSIILVLVAGVEYSLRQVPNNYRYKQSLIDNRGKRMKHIVAGSSVVNCCINPACLSDSAYNLAISGQWYRYNLAFLEKNLEKMPHLKTIIFGICYQSFWEDDSSEHDIRSIVSHQIYLGIGEVEGLPVRSEFLAAGSLALRKWSKYYLRRKSTMYCDSLGLDYAYASWEQSRKWREEIEERAISQNVETEREENARLFEENRRRLDKLAAICEAKGIRLVFVIPPVYKRYYECTNEKQWELVRSALLALKSRWSCVDYRDYSSDTRFEESDFYDGNHLSADIGGVKFSRILKEELGRDLD